MSGHRYFEARFLREESAMASYSLSTGPVLKLAVLGAVVTAAAVTAGCRTDDFQTAFYTNSRGHYPTFKDQSYILLVKPDHPAAIVEWVDVAMFRITVPLVEKDYYKLPWLQDPLRWRNGDRMTVEIESLIEPTQTENVVVRDGDEGEVDFPGQARIYITPDDTNWGIARLDKLVIDFEPAFLDKVRAMVHEPAERLDKHWKMLRPRAISTTTKRREVGLDNFTFELTAKVDPRLVKRPVIDMDVQASPVSETVAQTVYDSTWEYWLIDPTRSGATPAKMKPDKKEQGPKTVEEGDADKEVGNPQPAADQEIRFNITELKGREGFVSEGSFKLDRRGRATFDLMACVPAASLPIRGITVGFRAAADPNGKTVEVFIKREDLAKWEGRAGGK